MTGSAELIKAEIRALRKGRGVHASNLEQLLGDSLRELAAGSGDATAGIRGALIAELDYRTARLPDDLRTAVRASLGMIGATKAMLHFKDRVSWLAVQLKREERTALRRIDDAEKLLAEDIARELSRRNGRIPVAPDGWYLDELRTLLRMDGPTPEFYEHRRIVATRDGLREVMAWMDVPQDNHQLRPTLSAEVLYGGLLVRREQPTRSRFQFIVQFPAPLQAGESHEYGLLLRVPEGQPMRPHCVITPECQCNCFTLRVRFDPARKPRWIRRVQGETVRMFDSTEPVSELIDLDEAGELELRFDHPALYLGYGMRWQPF